MFKPEKEVPSLELCKKLKELGFPQGDGGFYWVHYLSNQWSLGYYEFIEIDYCQWEVIKAPTASELLKWLPEEITIDTPDVDRPIGWAMLAIYKDENLYEAGYGEYIEFKDNFSDALAKSLIWCIKNGYVKFEKEMGYERD